MLYSGCALLPIVKKSKTRRMNHESGAACIQGSRYSPWFQALTRYLGHTPSHIPCSTETTVFRGMLQLFQISQMVLQLGMIGNACKPNTQEAE